MRALNLALARFEITSKDQTRALEKEWAAYRKRHQMDVEGKAPESCPQLKIGGENPRSNLSGYPETIARADSSRYVGLGPVNVRIAPDQFRPPSLSVFFDLFSEITSNHNWRLRARRMSEPYSPQPLP
jgi:hypothetical protein